MQWFRWPGPCGNWIARPWLLRGDKENAMTDPKTTPTDDNDVLQKKGSGVASPDQTGNSQLAQKPDGPASGGDGAAGSGGPKGFGTGK